MKRYMIAGLLAAFTLTLHAQTARQVLDKTAAVITQSGGVRAKFKATQFKGSIEDSSTSGTMWLQGRMFKMDTPEMITWYNGKTEWTMLKGSDEVNVSEPTVEEQQAINPYSFINIYKKGYTLSMKKGTLRGKPTYVVTMRAKRKQAISNVLIDVDSNTYAPLCIRALRDGNWTRLAIQSFSAEKLSESTFTFPASAYPEVEIIDLR